MINNAKIFGPLKRFRKSMLYSRLRQYLPMPEGRYVDDSRGIENAEIVRIEWPENIEKPRIGLVRDFMKFPRWTKYRRFLENNAFPYGIYDIHAHDWVHGAQKYDIVVGMVSSAAFHLSEIRDKYHFLETYLGKRCFPSSKHALLYENKLMEAYISQLCGLPYARTHIFQSKDEALAILEGLNYPLISKICPSSGGVGVQFVRTPRQARRMVESAFSSVGRKIHVPYYRQKNYVYFQDYVPNDGYDIRVIVVGDRAFGYYRKVPAGDFRASGMGLVEKRALPIEAIRIALRAYRCVQSPLLAVDMVHALDGSYAILEFSPFFLWETAEQLVVDGIPGAYVIDDNDEVHFEKGRFWVDELALREFLLNECLPAMRA